MAGRKRIVYDKWYGGMSNDPNVWGVGSFYDGWGVEIRKDSKKITLSSNASSESVMNTRSTGQVIGSIFHASGYDVVATKDWRLAGFTTHENSIWAYYIHTSNFYNLFRYNGTSDYWVVIASDKILRWSINTSSTSLWIVGTQVVAEPEFDATWAWNVGTGWSITGWEAAKTAGNTNTLTQILTVSNATKYVVNVVCGTITAGTLTVSMWGSTLGTITTANSQVATSFTRTTTSTTEEIIFTPSNDFAGSLRSVNVSTSNIAEAITGTTFNEQSPVLFSPNIIYIGNGNVITQIDTTSSTWVASTVLTIDKWFVIRGLTKIGDQIFVYATDWAITKQYLWDGASTAADRVITWYDKPLQRVISWNNIDYLVVKNSSRSSLWLVNGYQPQLLFQSDYITNSSEDKFSFDCDYVNSIETIGTKFVFSSGSEDLYTYGTYTNGFAPSIVREYNYVGSKITNIYYAEEISNNLFFFYSSSKSGTFKNYWASLTLRAPNYSPLETGILVTLPIYWTTGYSTTKSLLKCRVGYKLNHSSNKIIVYRKVNDWEAYASFVTSWVTTVPTAWATYTNNWNTYTVISTTTAFASGWVYVVHCSYTWTSTISASGILTKTWGKGDSSVTFYKSLAGFELTREITDLNENKDMFISSFNFNKIQFAIQLITATSSYSPEVYDFIPVFEEKDYDL